MDTHIARTYRYRIALTSHQAERLTAWQRGCHEVQRLCILQRRIVANTRAYLVWGGQGTRKDGTVYDRWFPRSTVKAPTQFDQQKQITELRHDDPAIADIPADTLNDVAKRIDLAYAAYWKKLRNGQRVQRPRWADHAADIALYFRGADRGTRLERTGNRSGRLYLAGAGKLGAIRIVYHRLIPRDVVIKTALVSYRLGHWYVSVACYVPKPAPRPRTDRSVGVDANVIREGDYQAVAAVSDGRTYHVPASLARNAERLARLQRQVSHTRRVNGAALAPSPTSKRTAKRRERIAKMHQRITAQRDAALHFAAKRIVDTADVVGIEALNLGGMRRKGKGRRKRGLNRAMATAAPGKMFAMIREKAEVAGVDVIAVNPAYTSQICSHCGARGERKDLSIRRWRCDECGTTHHRDMNAARNIRQRALGTQTIPEPALSGGLRGEGDGIADPKRRSKNREGASPQRRAGRQRTTAMGSSQPTPPRTRRTQIVQVSLWDLDHGHDQVT